MTASVSLYAQAPKEYAGEAFSALSPNGQYAISSSYESTAIRNLTTGEVYSYTESYYAGNGNVASNTGVVVGMTMAPMAQYWKDGEWHDLPSVADRLMSKADGITPDGSRIVGSVSPETYGGDYEGMMLVPCYWDMQADGTPGELHMLPSPKRILRAERRSTSRHCACRTTAKSLPDKCRTIADSYANPSFIVRTTMATGRMRSSTTNSIIPKVSFCPKTREKGLPHSLRLT